MELTLGLTKTNESRFRFLEETFQKMFNDVPFWTRRIT